MTPDQYVESILLKYHVLRGSNSPAERLGSAVAGPLRTWAKQYLNELRYSGSYAKETGVHGVSDVDVFISLKSETPGTLKDLYNQLYRFATEQGWSPRQQNVSIGVTVNGTQGDLVPGKVQPGSQNYHSLYLRKKDSWTQTNVALHIEKVRNSGRLREIRAIKVWRLLHGLDFPSLYLELFTIQSLTGRSQSTLAENVLHTLRTMSASLASTRVEDPANSNNVLSDDLTKTEKDRIANLARQSSQEHNWGSIIW
jgi:hypothetical protein